LEGIRAYLLWISSEIVPFALSSERVPAPAARRCFRGTVHWYVANFRCARSRSFASFRRSLPHADLKLFALTFAILLIKGQLGRGQNIRSLPAKALESGRSSESSRKPRLPRAFFLAHVTRALPVSSCGRNHRNPRDAQSR